MAPAPVPLDRVYSRAELRADGWSGRALTAAVRAGTLTRLRRDHYVFSEDEANDLAVRVGGRESCVTLLARYGVFVFDEAPVHIRVHRHASRLRIPPRAHRSGTFLDHVSRRPVRLHWRDGVEPPVVRHVVELGEALRDAILCQQPRHVVATLDSVLFLGLLSWGEVAEIVRSLPPRFHVLLALVDGRAESGIESLVRLILRQLAASVEVQVRLEGVGRVDFIVDGWLIIECDSKAHHEGWDKQRRDRRRDLAAAAQGYTTIRPLAEDVLYAPETLVPLLAATIRARRGRG